MLSITKSVIGRLAYPAPGCFHISLMNVVQICYMHISVDTNIKYVNIDLVHDDHVCSSFDSYFLCVVFIHFVYLFNEFY
jgi:hypothetical protein